MAYEEMRLLYEKHGKNAQLKRLFARGETEYNKEKLEHELNKLNLDFLKNESLLKDESPVKLPVVVIKTKKKGR